MIILNLTQHLPTHEQIEAGVINLPDDIWNEVKNLLTFSNIADTQNVVERADHITRLATRYLDQTQSIHDDWHVMIGGAPYLMTPLVESLKSKTIQPLYSFTERQSVEVNNTDGSVSKQSVFKHVGWVEA